ncbi:hypothetical protein F8M41_004088 [Gigaspora margarita]|uniref:Uncharacterized protein n=1 Tax=Gigaspora margarita TaxID=4874 RepID=A0A8H3XA95_GIGMA|nr:hypothetical protein F8M41_004088 [Gigaspora margarita]
MPWTRFLPHLYLALLLSYDMSTFKDLVIILLHDYKVMEKKKIETRSTTDFTGQTTTNLQNQNNNETPHDIPNSERRYDMPSLKFLSSSTNLGLILRACASWSSIMPV